jgi:hypothetical protein
VIRIYVIKGWISHRFKLPADQDPFFRRDNCTKARKSPFELAERLGVPIQHELSAEQSEEAIHNKGYLFMDYRRQQIFRIGRSDDMAKSIIKYAIRATSKSQIDDDSAVQMRDDAIKYV